MFMRNPRLVAEADRKVLDGVKHPVQRRVLANAIAAANEEAELEELRRHTAAWERLKRGNVRRA